MSMEKQQLARRAMPPELPYFRMAVNGMKDGKKNWGDVAAEVIAKHADGRPVTLRTEDIPALKEAGVTLDQLAADLPFLMFKKPDGKISKICDMLGEYTKTGDIKVLSTLAEIYVETVSYHTRPGQAQNYMTSELDWCKVVAYTQVGEHGRMDDGRHANFDSYSAFKHKAFDGEVLVFHLQDGVTRNVHGKHSEDGLNASNNVNGIMRRFNENYNWNKIIQEAKNGTVLLEGYVSGIKRELENNPIGIDATTLSTMIIIRVEGKTYAAGIMVNGNSPVVKISGDDILLLNDEKEQIKNPGVAKLSQKTDALDNRIMTVVELKKGDTIAIGSDGVNFMANLIDAQTDNSIKPKLKELYERENDDATAVIVTIN